jgi:hypothetical protein
MLAAQLRIGGFELGGGVWLTFGGGNSFTVFSRRRHRRRQLFDEITEKKKLNCSYYVCHICSV